MDITWMTGGKQGSGIDVALGLFSRIMMKYGYSVFGYREYFSNIKGMHSFFTVRVSSTKKNSLPSKVDIAVFFDKESVIGEKNMHSEVIHYGHILDVVSGGTLIVDTSFDKSLIKRNDIHLLQINTSEIINAVASNLKKPAGAMSITKNIIAVTSSVFLLGIEESVIKEMIKEEFRTKPVTVIETDQLIAEETIDYMKRESIKPTMLLEQMPKKERMYTEGFTSTALGKAIAGCKIQIYYPITPASDESIFIEGHPELGIRVIQPESELAVIAMLTGAAIAGARAATSTSGPGLSLMTETITYAGITETPIVVVNHQRGSPATGQPTRTGQGDLLFAINQGHGEFGRIILAPGTVNQYLELTANAFNYAEKYQLPVIIVGEKAIAQASLSMDTKFVEDFKASYRIDRGKFNQGEIKSDGGDYKRFKFTDDNISERIRPGNKSAVMWLTGDEHDEYGHPYEEPNNRNRMMQKRMGKSNLILSELKQNEKYELYGNPSESDILIISWGSPTGAILDCITDKESFLQLKLIEPLPFEVGDMIKKAKKIVCIEQSLLGQLRTHIASRTGIMIKNQILKYNGRPIKYDELSEAIQKIKRGETKVLLNEY